MLFLSLKMTLDKKSDGVIAFYHNCGRMHKSFITREQVADE